MADGKLEIKVVVDGLDMDKLNKKLKELKAELSKPAKGAGFDEFKKNLDDVSDKTTKTKGKVKELKDEVAQPAKSKGLDNVKDDLSKTGKEAETAKTKVKGLTDELQKPIPDSTKGVPEKLKKTGDEAEKGKSKVKDFFLAFSAVRIAEKAISVLTSSLDGAIKRFDTLNSYPRVLKLMGFEAKQVAKSTKQLSEGIDGLPTSLDEVVATSKQLTTITKDIDYSTKLTLALNNAFLASGSSSEDASRGLVQYQQMLSSGKVDMQSWKTLQETMPIALARTAEAFGFTGASAKVQFYEALRDGKITFHEFGKKLIELNKGVGGFAELAKESSRGIGTSLHNLANTSVKGLGNMIQAFDDFTKSVTGQNIDQHIDKIKYAVNGAFSTMNTVIRSASIPIAFIVQGFGKLLEACPPLKFALDALIVAFATMLGWALLQAILAGLATGFTAVTTALIAMKVAVTGLLGPVGWATVAVAGLYTAYNAFMDYLKSDELKKAEADIKNLKKATDELTKSVSDNNEQRASNLKDIKASGKAHQDLLNEIMGLASAEKLSGAQKILLRTKIEKLNQSIEGLNLKYDKNTGRLSMNRQEIEARIKAGEGNNKLVAIEKELTDAYKDQTNVLEQMKAVEREKDEITKASNISDRDKKQKLKELDEQYKQLQATHKATETSINSLSLAQKEAAVQVASAVEEGANRQVVSYESLSANQQKIMDDMRKGYDDLKNSAQTAFERIKQDSVVATSAMTENLLANTETVKNFSINIETLTNRGVNEGLLEILKQAGPKAASQVQSLVNSSDKELEQLSKAFEDGGTEALEAFRRVYNIPVDEFTEPIKNLVMNSKQTLTGAIAEANFGELGKNVTEGITEGVKSNANAPSEAISEIGTNISDKFGNVMGIQSPSTVMAEKGQFIVDGIVQGIEQSQSKVESIMQAVGDVIIKKMDSIVNDTRNKANELPKVFDAIRSSMVSSGEYAMYGLAQGIENGSGSAIAKANSIASRIKSTIKSALDIHSPSRVMRDEVGRFIPEGLAVGIDKYANTVDTPLQRMKQRIADFDFSADNIVNRGRRVFENGLNAFSSNNYLQMEIANGGFTVEVPVTVGEREIAKVIAPIVRSENKRVERLERFTRGEK